MSRSFVFKGNSKYLPVIYLVIIILLGLETFWEHLGDGPKLVMTSYWKNHGIFLLLFLTMFPRLALFLSSIASGGLLWWLGWLIAPRVLVAILATESYLQTNPFLVIVAWMIAISGEFSEKEFVRRRSYSYFDQPTHKPFGNQQEIDESGKTHSAQQDETIIDADFKDLS